MKLSTLAFSFAFLFASVAVSANVHYVKGKYENHDSDGKTISIVKVRGGDKATYRYSDIASQKNDFGNNLKFSSLRRGEVIVLKLKAVNK